MLVLVSLSQGTVLTYIFLFRYCAEHSKKALLARQKAGRKRPADFAQRCLEDLTHYKRERLAAAASVAVTSVELKKEPGQSADTSVSSGAAAATSGTVSPASSSGQQTPSGAKTPVKREQDSKNLFGMCQAKSKRL